MRTWSIGIVSCTNMVYWYGIMYKYDVITVVCFDIIHCYQDITNYMYCHSN